MFLRFLSIFFLLILVGCERSALVLHQQKITSTYLASTNVGSPDSRTPPSGEMIVAEWWIPSSVRDLDPTLRIHILFQDFSETVVEYPIRSRAGYESYLLINQAFKKKGGLLAYRAEIITSDGRIFAEWKHQLWVKLIDIEGQSEEINSSVIEKSIQPSVIETPASNSDS